MSLPGKQLYEFGDFRLDPVERILMRGDETLELTPKGFELLKLFVENHGRLLSKDELMEKIWADSFVEEGNLTFNIRQLRVILDDDAHNPKYIKTVRRHGYRFIADVKQISKETESEQEAELPVKTTAPNDSPSAKTAFIEKSVAPPKTKNFLAPALVTSAVLLAGAVVIGFWYTQSKSVAPDAPVLSTAFASEKLSTNGKVFNAAISPDGRNVVYTNITSGGKESVWLRQLEDGNNVQIIPPSDEVYRGFAFSPDGKLLYFVRGPRQTGEKINVYRISIFGGVPTKIINDVEGWISISPDGAHISFVRCPYREDEYCSLWTADSADGKNERRLTLRPRPFRIGGNRISPDGNRIAFATGQSENAANEFSLMEIDLETGTERELTTEKFFNIKNLVWLPDASGWLLTASRIPNKNFLIWKVSAATGETAPLTKDSESYSELSLDKDATKIISTQFKQDFRLQLINPENPSPNRFLADAAAVMFAPDGRIYFASIMSGNDEIWSINADGGNQRQLTNNPADDRAPIVSPDGNSIFFLSNRTGAGQVWRMNADGINQTQITQKEGGFPLAVSPDGEWVYYRHGVSNTLWRVSLKTGEEQLVLNKVRGYFAISPDGAQVAYSESQGDERILMIASLASGQKLKTFPLADKKSLLLNISWMPDGKSLAYITANRALENNVLWQQPLDGNAPQQIAALGDKETTGAALSVSPDGKTFAIVQGEWLHDAVLIKGLR